MASQFWDDLNRDLADPEFLREYVAASVRIATVDSIINSLDAARVAAGLSKAELARAVGLEPANVRRLFTSARANPTLGTLAEVAAALGLRIRIEPMTDAECAAIAVPLRTGHPAAGTAERAVQLRQSIGRLEAA